jgi:hypothetical protein
VRRLVRIPCSVRGELTRSRPRGRGARASAAMRATRTELSRVCPLAKVGQCRQASRGQGQGAGCKLPSYLLSRRGTVDLAYLISDPGFVEPCSIRIIATTDSDLVAVAYDMAAAERFCPAEQDGHAIRVRVLQRFRFKGYE